MPFTVLARRSNVAGHVPNIAQLNTGQLTLNTNDGLLYFLQSTATGNNVVCLGPAPSTANALTTPVTISLSNAITGSTVFSGTNNVTITTTLTTVGSVGTYASYVRNPYGQVTSGSVMTATGDLSGTSVLTNLPLTLANSGVVAGTYNYGTLVVNAKGLITSISGTPTIRFSGDLTGNAAYGSNVTLLLNNTIDTSPGTYIWGAATTSKGFVTGPLTGTFASTFSVSAGYQVLPSGFIMQWGIGGIDSTSSTTQSVTFPITFPNNVLNIQLADVNGTFASTSGFFFSAPLSNSATSFTLYYNCVSTSPNPTFYFWVAIGH